MRVKPATYKWAPLALGLILVVALLAITMLRGEWSPSEPTVKCSLKSLSGSGEVNVEYLGRSGFKTLKVNLSEWGEIARELERLGYKGECVIALGLTTCPYCKSLERFLAQNYGGITMWLYVDKSIELRDAASKIVMLELKWGVPADEALAVPNVIVIDKNGTPKYVIIGAYLDKKLWDSLLYS
ncbi:MAG: hypothetical protein P3X22_006295 [Thermoprotei archaeon]|nr:hypothetical protein [Thermoprotei archaeon]